MVFLLCSSTIWKWLVSFLEKEHVLDLGVQSLCSNVLDCEKVLRFHLHGAEELSQSSAQDFCVHSGLTTEHAVPMCGISFKTELKPVNILSIFLQDQTLPSSTYHQVEFR